jgi:hypothetical protein
MAKKTKPDAGEKPRKKRAPGKPARRGAKNKPDAEAKSGEILPPALVAKPEAGAQDKDWQGARRGRRPKLEPDAKTLDMIFKLGCMRCTQEETAAFLNVALSTFKEFCKRHPEAKDTFHDGNQAGKVSLRRNQFALSKKNAAMAIWLGKVWLGQREIVEHELSGKNGGPIETKDVSARDVLASRIAGIASRTAANSNTQGPKRRTG